MRKEYNLRFWDFYSISVIRIMLSMVYGSEFVFELFVVFLWKENYKSESK